MINWKICLIILIFIEIIYRLIIFYNYRLTIKPFYITLINCPKEHLYIRYYLDNKLTNFIRKFFNWYKIIFGCQIIEYKFYLSNIIRLIDGILFIILLTNIIC